MFRWQIASAAVPDPSCTRHFSTGRSRTGSSGECQENRGRRGKIGGRATLTLGELRAAPSSVETVFLPFFHPGVASEKLRVAHRRVEFLIEADEGASDSHAARSGLSGRATSLDVDQYIDFVAFAGRFENFEDGTLVLGTGEVLL